MATAETAAEGADRTRVNARRLIVIGGGEHAAVVVDAIRTCPDEWLPIAFSDPDPRPGASRRLELEHIFDDDVGQRLRLAPGDAPSLVLGIGGPAVRREQAAARFAGASWATIVHASAWVSPSATLEEGSVVLGGAIVNAGARIGRHVIVNTGAVIEHDVRLGDFVHVGPRVAIGGGATIGPKAFVGLGAVVRDHTSVGANASIGMGAVVVEDVPADTLVVGSPARPHGSAPLEEG
jgi:sugar O-acyltransferase (sialic acid O-acetyltransferase NeuD family)